MDRIAGWIVGATQTSQAATATKAAVANKQHIIYGLSGSFSGADPTGGTLLVLKDGTTVIGSWFVAGAFDVNFPAGVAITTGNAVSAVLSDGGTGITGAVNLHGVTR